MRSLHTFERRRWSRAVALWAAAAVVCGLALSTAAPAAAAAAAPAAADEDGVVSWSVRPADEVGADGRSWVEIEAEPGSTTTEHLEIRNLGDVAVTFAVTGADAYFTETGRFNMIPSDQESTDAGTWIEIADAVTLDAGQSRILPFAVAVPADAAPGDHAAGIAASVFSRGSGGGGTVGVESRVGFRVMVRVAGPVDASVVAEASGVYVTDWNPLEPGGISLSYTLQNTGNVRMSVTASAPGSRDADAGAGELLPGDERTAQLTIPDVWPLGVVTVPLTVEQSVVMPDGSVSPQDPLVLSVTVWAVPWPQLIVLVALGLLVVGALWGRRRRRASVDRLVEEAREEGRREARIQA